MKMLFSRNVAGWIRMFLCTTTGVYFLIGNCHAQTTTSQRHRETNHHNNNNEFYIGTGIYDMTGPAAQINFMGYAQASQTAHGIHMRLRARAFIVSESLSSSPSDSDESPSKQDPESTAAARGIVGVEEDGRLDDDDNRDNRLRQEPSPPIPLIVRWSQFLRGQTKKEEAKITRPSEISKLDPEKTICFVSIDAGMGSDLLNRLVLKRLEELLPNQANSGKRLCHLENLSISGTHTHSAPAGFIQYVLYQITSMGFSREVMDTYVEGIAQSILRAYNSLEKGSVSLAKDLLFDANINRSPTSYLLNPKEERDQYVEEGDTDKTMLQLKFVSENGYPKGILNWFAVHGTSMNKSNLLISGDNKGYSSYLMEKYVNGNDTLPGKGSFVAAFASTNLGDVSPNTAGPRCLDTGLPCDLHSSTCNGRNALCVAFGPGKNMKESTEIIGRKQYETSLSLFQKDSASEPLSGSVAFRHSFVDMSNKTVTLESGEVVRTCPAALGYAFAAGTTDGPGEFDFTQGQNTSNPFWNMIGGFLSPPSEEQKRCHSPKPILLNTGLAHLPYAWDPNAVPISVFRMGKLFILSVPCELTTMAGRRLRAAVRNLLVNKGIQDPEITIAGLANSYTHYVTTFEEYGGQRYEAASTLYGPHTLSAYIQEFERITTDLLDGTESRSDEPPTDLGKKQISLLPPVIIDTIGIGREFGSVAIDAKNTYTRGVDTVFVSFRSANPRNNQRIEGTFLTVDLLTDDGSWRTVYSDGDWSTSYFWKSSIESLGVSFAEISWEIPSETPQGIYRICHFGTRKTLLGGLQWALMHAPDWWTLDGSGSIAVGTVLQAVKSLEAFSETVRWALEGFDLSRKKDFSGCSRSFLVRANH